MLSKKIKVVLFFFFRVCLYDGFLPNVVWPYKYVRTAVVLKKIIES